MVFSKELIRGSLAPVILRLVEDRPMYGYEMVKLVNARTQGVLEWKEGTLYPALHKLEAEGLIDGHWQETSTLGGDKSERQRKYYSITRAGRAERKKRGAEWTVFTSAVATLLQKV
jgi:PadR family transcriptional regulator PadR